MALLAKLHPLRAGSSNCADRDSASSGIVEMQQAALLLLTRLGRYSLAQDLIAPSWSELLDDSALEPISGPQAVAALLVRLLSLLDSASLHVRVITARLLGELLLPRSPVRDMLVRAGVVAKLARLSGDSYAWQAADSDLPWSADTEGDSCCSSGDSLPLAQQLRHLVEDRSALLDISRAPLGPGPFRSGECLLEVCLGRVGDFGDRLRVYRVDHGVAGVGALPDAVDEVLKVGFVSHVRPDRRRLSPSQRLASPY